MCSGIKEEFKLMNFKVKLVLAPSTVHRKTLSSKIIMLIKNL